MEKEFGNVLPFVRLHVRVTCRGWASNPFEENQEEETPPRKPESSLVIVIDKAGGSRWHLFSVHRVSVNGLICLNFQPVVYLCSGRTHQISRAAPSTLRLVSDGNVLLCISTMASPPSSPLQLPKPLRAQIFCGIWIDTRGFIQKTHCLRPRCSTPSFCPVGDIGNTLGLLRETPRRTMLRICFDVVPIWSWNPKSC